MNIDIAALRMLEREREISFETIIGAIESALLTAYRHTEGAQVVARVEIDRKTGAARVWATEPAQHGIDVTAAEEVAAAPPTAPRVSKPREFDDTPDGFGRIAATTAKQVMLQRLRDATDDATFGGSFLLVTASWSAV